jgi:endonuclease/exonuclease/phosphatase (EEP) superfamily protein YafD
MPAMRVQVSAAAIMRALLSAALLGGTVVSLAGALVPVYPPADIANHFRPFAFASASVLLIGALALRARQSIWWAAALASLNAVLLVLPLLWSAEPAGQATSGQALAGAGTRDLKIVTFNTLFGREEPVARFLLGQDADIVVLQEIAPRQAPVLAALLQARYPHSHACGVQDRCAAAIFAKRPWVAAGREEWTKASPEIVWVQFDDAEIGRLRVLGVHLALPLRPESQARHVDRLIALRAALTGPLIIAGDLNMTPWSFRLQRLLASAGLRRHATFLRSWPTDGRFGLPGPTFLIDHVLATPDIESVSIRVGSHTASDHLPVIAQLRLPAR